ALAEPFGVGVGVARADVQHRHVAGGLAAIVTMAPVDPVAAHEVAAARVVHHRVTTASGGGAVTGGDDETPELVHRDSRARHRDAAVEADVVLGTLAVGR